MTDNEKLQADKITKNEAQKRKLEEFLCLVRQDLAKPIPRKRKKNPANSFAESYKVLKDELRKYKNQSPSFTLKKSNCTKPLFVKDILHFLFTSVLGDLLPPNLLRWAKFENAHNVSKTVFLEIEGLSQSDIIEMQTKFNEKQSVFPCIIEILPSKNSFVYDLSILHLPIYSSSRGKKDYSSKFPDVEIESNTGMLKTSLQNNISKLHLLLSPIQLAMEHYPLPQNVFEQSKSRGYYFSKEQYSPVSEFSPMFAVDCEMCRTVSGRQEVTRIAIVNENLETVYHTLVKPNEKITDYITRFSGITEKMLQNVTTTLDDVQKDIRRILPSDAILCGQSLNCDLHGLRIIHPYIIDTSIIYNEDGVRQKKSSLKKLVQIHLKENIQNSKKGHNPIEDAIASMKLVQLKLKKFVEYGDAALINNAENVNEGINTSSSPEDSFKPSDQMNPDLNSCEFFSMISKLSKKICLIGSKNYLSNYPDAVIANASIIIKSKLKKIIKATADNIENHDLILSHLTLEKENHWSVDLSNDIKQLYNSLPEKTVFIIFITNAFNTTEEKLQKNHCMITVKTDKSL